MAMKLNKIKGLVRLRVREILKPLKKYGQDVYVDTAENEIVKLAEEMIKESMYATEPPNRNTE